MSLYFHISGSTVQNIFHNLQRSIHYQSKSKHFNKHRNSKAVKLVKEGSFHATEGISFPGPGNEIAVVVHAWKPEITAHTLRCAVTLKQPSVVETCNLNNKHKQFNAPSYKD